jgi:hypothetical protein
VLIGIPERLVGTEIEAPLDPDNQGLTVIIAARLNRHSKTSKGVMSRIQPDFSTSPSSGKDS